MKAEHRHNIQLDDHSPASIYVINQNCNSNRALAKDSRQAPVYTSSAAAGGDGDGGAAVSPFEARYESRIPCTATLRWLHLLTVVNLTLQASEHFPISIPRRGTRQGLLEGACIIRYITVITGMAYQSCL